MSLIFFGAALGALPGVLPGTLSGALPGALSGALSVASSAAMTFAQIGGEVGGDIAEDIAEAVDQSPEPTTLSEIHESFSFFMVIGNGLAGIWALLAHWHESLRRRALWWFVGIAQVFIAIQVSLGVGLIAIEDREVDAFHLFYGFVALASVGIIYSYRSQIASKKYLLYGLGGLFLMGLGIRAMLVGGSTS